MSKKIVAVGGQDYTIAGEEYKTLVDDWNEYETASGVKVRVRLIVNQIARVVDKEGKPAFDAQGEPRILIGSQNIVVATGGPKGHADDDAEVH